MGEDAPMTKTIPHCLWCKHLKPGLNCDAFPERIPDAIIDGLDSHVAAYPGDHGIRFELKDGDVDTWHNPTERGA
jgi:hypothetical protein